MTERQQARRDRLLALALCINGPLPDATRGRSHGLVVRGGKCQRCLDVHKRTDTSAARMERHYRALGVGIDHSA